MKIDCRIEDGSELAKLLEMIQSQGRGKRSDYIRNALQFYYEYPSVHKEMLQMLQTIQQQQLELMDRLEDIERQCSASKDAESVTGLVLNEADGDFQSEETISISEEDWLDYLKAGLDDFE